MTSIYRLAISGVALFAAASTFAASIIGIWHGHADTSAAKMPAGMSADQFGKMKTMVASMKFTLVLNASKTFAVTFSGGMVKTPQTKKGKWSQSGNKVTLVDAATSSSPAHPQVLVVSANGKMMTMTPGNDGAKLEFVR